MYCTIFFFIFLSGIDSGSSRQHQKSWEKYLNVESGRATLCSFQFSGCRWPFWHERYPPLTDYRFFPPRIQTCFFSDYLWLNHFKQNQTDPKMFYVFFSRVMIDAFFPLSPRDRIHSRFHLTHRYCVARGGCITQSCHLCACVEAGVLFGLFGFIGLFQDVPKLGGT